MPAPLLPVPNQLLLLSQQLLCEAGARHSRPRKPCSAAGSTALLRAVYTLVAR